MRKLLVLLIFVSAIAKAQTGKIEGRVFDEKNNEALPFTSVIIYGTTIGSLSDLDGKFIYTGLKPGFVRLALSSVGYKTFVSEEIQVTNSKTTYIEIGLEQVAIQTEEIVITSTPFIVKKESPVSLRTLSISEIEKTPGGNRDISKVIQSFPGVASTVAFRNDIIVRGGGPSENRFYLDGIEIPNINHFATQGASGGPVGIINTDFIREVDFYSGAFPAAFGNAISSILSMKQVDGNKERIKFKGSVGATDLALTVDGPLNKNTTYIASIRRSYLQLLFGVIGLPFLPTYNDYQFKIKSKLNEKSELTIVSIGALDDSKLNLDIKNPDETQSYILSYLPELKQWNYTIGANYKHFRKKSFENIIVSRNMLNNESFKYFNNDNSKSENLILNYVSQEIENKFRYENTRTIQGYRIVAGTGLEYNKYNNSTQRKIVLADTSLLFNYSSDLKLFRYYIFGQGTKSYFSDRLTLSFGFRLDGNSYSKEMANLLRQFSPRLSASYILTEKFTLNFNSGIYYQQPAYTTLGYKDKNGDLVNKKNGITFIKSDHVVGGLEYRPTDNTRITLEGFFKNYSDYPFSVTDSIALASKGGDFGTIGDEEVIPTGQGRAYGAELLVQEKDFKGFNVILSYTFVRSEFKDFFEKYIPSAWDNIHLLNLTVRKSFANNWDIGLKWRFVGGTPYTPYDLNKSSLIYVWDVNGRGVPDFSKFNSMRFKPFHQLDIRVDKSFFFKKWSLVVYGDVQNAYNFQSEQQEFLLNTDESGIKQFDPNDPTRYLLRSIKTTSGTVLPTIGIIVEF